MTTPCREALISLLSACALLGGCGESPVEKAERRYDWVKQNGTLSELCDAAGQLKEAYFNTNNKSQYELWSSATSINCMTAKLEGGYLPADPERRKASTSDETELTMPASLRAAGADPSPDAARPEAIEGQALARRAR